MVWVRAPRLSRLNAALILLDALLVLLGLVILRETKKWGSAK